MSSGTFGSGLTDSAGAPYNDPMQDFDDSGGLGVNDAISNVNTPGITADNWKAKLEKAMPDILAALGASDVGGATPMRASRLEFEPPDMTDGVMKSTQFQYTPMTRSNSKSGRTT